MTSNNEIKPQELDKNMRVGEESSTPLVWHLPCEAPMELSGFPWFEQDKIYRRLPANPPEKLRDPVDRLANCTAGGQIRFQTNSRHIAVRVELSGLANMNHMPATGQCGFDLYLGPAGRQTFCNVTKYDHTEMSYEIVLFEHHEAVPRNITLNFPLYQGVKEVHVGLDLDCTLEPPLPWALDKPIVVYGTSITQGGCASRPGMAYTNILSRKLNAEIVNLGFSGNGFGDPEIARLMAGLPTAALFVLDYEANCTEFERLERTLPEFIKILRERHPDVPILVPSRPNPAGYLYNPAIKERRTRCRTFIADTVEDCRNAGDQHIHFLNGETLLGDDFDECTVDGSHPTDLGFYRMAQAIEPVFREILGLRA